MSCTPSARAARRAGSPGAPSCSIEQEGGSHRASRSTWFSKASATSTGSPSMTSGSGKSGPTAIPTERPCGCFTGGVMTLSLAPPNRVKGRAVMELLRPNALFLSTAASANHPALLPLYAWFTRNLRLAEVGSREFRQALTTQLLDDDTRRGQVLALLRAADLGITGAKMYELDPVMKERLQRAVRIIAGQEGEPDGADEGPAFDQLGVRLIHHGAGGEVELDARDESLGTLVWFGLSRPSH